MHGPAGQEPGHEPGGAHGPADRRTGPAHRPSPVVELLPGLDMVNHARGASFVEVK